MPSPKVKLVTVEFTGPYTVQDEKRKTDKATSYRKGQKVKMAEESALHFVRKGVARFIATAARG